MGHMHMCVCESGVQTREMGDKDLAAIQRGSGGLDWAG